MCGRIFHGVHFIGIFMPSSSLPFIHRSICILEHLITVFTGDAKIEPPVWMVLVSRIARQATALQHRSNLPKLTQIPGMIQVILTNCGIDSDF